MHYHYFTLEQRTVLAGRLAALPDEQRQSGLQRLHSPGYGVCESCGGDIPFRLLLDDPLRKRCPGC